MKQQRTFRPVFIGYGLKTGQGFYPGPIYLQYFSCYFIVIFSKRYPFSLKYFKAIGNAYRNLGKALSLS